MSEVRLIDANELLKKKIHYGETEYHFDHYAVQIEDIENAPTIDAELIRHGHWEVIRKDSHTTCRCSVCHADYYYHNKGQYQIDTSERCPNCGAKMDEVTE